MLTPCIAIFLGHKKDIFEPQNLASAVAKFQNFTYSKAIIFFQTRDYVSLIENTYCSVKLVLFLYSQQQTIAAYSSCVHLTMKATYCCEMCFLQRNCSQIPNFVGHLMIFFSNFCDENSIFH